jgi:hypothetical protein
MRIRAFASFAIRRQLFSGHSFQQLFEDRLNFIEEEGISQGYLKMEKLEIGFQFSVSFSDKGALEMRQQRANPKSTCLERGNEAMTKAY